MNDDTKEYIIKRKTIENLTIGNLSSITEDTKVFGKVNDYETGNQNIEKAGDAVVGTKILTLGKYQNKKRV